MHPNTTLYSNETARWMVRFARAAYMSQPEAFRWLMDFDTDFVDLNLIKVDNSQACVITHPTFVVASFRGTDDIKDVIDGINARRYYAHEFEGAVHRGFYEALDSRLAGSVGRGGNCPRRERGHLFRFGSQGTVSAARWRRWRRRTSCRQMSRFMGSTRSGARGYSIASRRASLTQRPPAGRSVSRTTTTSSRASLHA